MEIIKKKIKVGEIERVKYNLYDYNFLNLTLYYP